MYGKLTNGVLIYAPTDVIYNGRRVFNPSDEMLEQLGYLPIMEKVKPTAEYGYYYEAIYLQESGYIEQFWDLRVDTEKLEMLNYVLANLPIYNGEVEENESI